MRKKQLSVAIAAMFAAVAQANQLESPAHVSKEFTVAPAAVQKMYDEIAQSSELLKKINIVGRIEKIGEIIGLSSGLVGSTTDTSGDATRKTRSIHSLAKREYRLEQTNFDTHLRYDEIDQWAHVVADFPARINKKVAESIAISLITIGLNGKTRAATSNFDSNPLLQDVAVGWLQDLRANNAARVMGWQSGQVGSQKQEVQYGAGAPEYKNLDAVVADVLNELIDERFADRTDFVVITSRRTVGDKYTALINKAGEQATETEAAARLNKERTLGGLPVMFVPNMPKDTLLITPLANLSIYYQLGGERRHIKDVPERDRIESYQSKNIDFVVEEYGAAALVENLKHVA